MSWLKNKSSENVVSSKCIASFPGLPTVKFLIACSMQKNRGGRPGPFYHINDVSVYLGRQKGWKGPRSRNTFVHTSFTLNVFCFVNV